tara:strand:+ start:681 stop:1436 length:756 start_codon:yes stop_codon:yes gene_type:complete
MRKNIVVANWKMNLNRVDAVTLVSSVLDKLSSRNQIEVVFAPSFVYLYKVANMCKNTTNVFVASQDCSANDDGSFTGEVSASMIHSCGARYVILGHSERRINFSETNELLRLKAKQALANSLDVIFCCGESLEQRKNGVYLESIKSQISDSLFHFSESEFSHIVIAYEPIWAIGTGVTASSDQAQEVHSFIRSIIADQYGDNVADSTSILYGGSCNSSNAAEIFSQKDIDGGLIGGASLNASDFVHITSLL